MKEVQKQKQIALEEGARVASLGSQSSSFQGSPDPPVNNVDAADGTDGADGVDGVARPSSTGPENREIRRTRRNRKKLSNISGDSGGLNNIGDSCYMNAVFQCLFSIPSFVEEVKGKGKELEEGGAGSPLLRAFLQLESMRESIPNEDKVQVLTSLRSTMNFDTGRQEDAHEFLTTFTDRLTYEYTSLPNSNDPAPNASSIPPPADDLASPTNDTSATSATTPALQPSASTSTNSPKPHPFVFPTDNCFEASVDEKLCCNSKQCGWIRSRKDPYKNFSTSVKSNLDSGLANFFNPEVLEIDCQRCSGKEAIQSRKLSNAPRVLLLHLKRFKQDGTKIQDGVAFQETIDLSKYFDENDENDKSARYKLKAVINHTGTFQKGHYITHGSNQNGKWFEYDDCSVLSKTLKDVTNKKRHKTAYIFAYELVEGPDSDVENGGGNEGDKGDGDSGDEGIVDKKGGSEDTEGGEAYEGKVSSLSEMGFELEQIKLALKNHNNNFELALNELTS
ncbi:hypothetical protein TrRE_jg2108 [Triparma retinervis]|uniref:Ubiquitin carboxyl-terminal hydrolase n=1 Tax=Triparma retinervis TaxID=2557542 RepID=A0A9W7FYJ5_9STRA|nr:hypothetical protein TrRE_jg2108 [Triparma retinervis]